jgi:sRNA-binding regulator protein Hfq
MAENLWALRLRKNLSVAQVAARSNIPAQIIEEYERGKPVRLKDVGRLARALYVPEDAIKLQSDPLPAPASAKAAPLPQPAPQEKPPKTPQQPGTPKSPAPVRPTQITHLLALAARIGVDRAALETELGKACEALTEAEAKAWLKQYTERQPPRAPRRDADSAPQSGYPEPVNRHRASLPDGIDEFEHAYLKRVQAERAVLEFTLFDGRRLTGRVIGFSLYAIAIQPAEGGEIVLRKLALAYYRRSS